MKNWAIWRIFAIITVVHFSRGIWVHCCFSTCKDMNRFCQEWGVDGFWDVFLQFPICRPAWEHSRKPPWGSSHTPLVVAAAQCRGSSPPFGGQYTSFGSLFLFVFLFMCFCFPFFVFLFLCICFCFCFCVHLVLARNLLALGGLNLPCNLGNDNVDNIIFATLTMTMLTFYFCNLGNEMLTIFFFATWTTRVPTIREIVLTSVIWKVALISTVILRILIWEVALTSLAPTVSWRWP